jgi:hypothetical protein
MESKRAAKTTWEKICIPYFENFIKDHEGRYQKRRGDNRPEQVRAMIKEWKVMLVVDGNHRLEYLLTRCAPDLTATQPYLTWQAWNRLAVRHSGPILILGRAAHLETYGHLGMAGQLPEWRGFGEDDTGILRTSFSSFW